MMVKEVLTYLDNLHPATALPFTLSDPHCDRGSYRDVAFALTNEPSTVAEVRAVVASVIGKTYYGWKGGDFTMDEWSDCCIGPDYGEVGEPITQLWLDAVTR